MAQKTRFYKLIMGFVLLETAFYLSYTLPWAIGFDSFINRTDHTKCQNPMWWWSNFTSYFFWISSLWNIISIPIRYNLLMKEVKNQPLTKFNTFIDATTVFQIIGGLVCLVMLTRAYEHRSTCTYLAPIVKLFLVSNLISLIIWCSGTYFLYMRLWKKAVEWVKKKELQMDQQDNENSPTIILENTTDEETTITTTPISNTNNNKGVKDEDETPLITNDSINITVNNESLKATETEKNQQCKEF